MNRTVTILACATLAAAPAAVAAPAEAGPQKIAVKEVQRIIQESAIGKEALARVQKLQQAKQEELVKRNKELRDLEEKIRTQGKSLSEDAMEKLRNEKEAKEVDVKRLQEGAQRDLEEAQRKELKTLEERIMPVIDAVGKEMGYNLIFNKFNSGLLFASEDVDITNAVITRFNTQIAASATSAKRVAGGPAAATSATAAAPQKPVASAATGPPPAKNAVVPNRDAAAEASDLWVRIRNDPKTYKGRVVTWRLKFRSWRVIDARFTEVPDAICDLNGDYRRPVRLLPWKQNFNGFWERFPNMADGDWIVVTGEVIQKMEKSRPDSVLLEPTNIVNEGFKD